MFPLNFSGLTLWACYYGHEGGYCAVSILDAAHAALPLSGKLLIAVLQGRQDPIAQHCANAHVPMLGAPNNGVFHDPWQADAQHGGFGTALFAQVNTGFGFVILHWGAFVHKS